MKHWLKTKLYKRFPISFSKSGDDIQLYKLIKQTTPGTYVDVGCWHPYKYSNSYFFYLRNWRGICIDPNPELIPLYKQYRPTDTFVNNAVSTHENLLTYYMLDQANSSMNSLDITQIKRHQLESKIQKQIEVPVRPLAAILDEQVKPNERIDFFDIDVEGLDLQVLMSNNWDKYRPKVIAIETNLSLRDDLNSEVVAYLEQQNYRLVGKTVIFNNLGNLYLLDNKQ